MGKAIDHSLASTTNPHNIAEGMSALVEHDHISMFPLVEEQSVGPGNKNCEKATQWVFSKYKFTLSQTILSLFFFSFFSPNKKPKPTW